MKTFTLSSEQIAMIEQCISELCDYLPNRSADSLFGELISQGESSVEYDAHETDEELAQ